MSSSAFSAGPSPSSLVYFGTYTRTASKGIYSARFDHDTGTLSAPHLVAETSNPTFLATHPRLPVLYAISEEALPVGSTGLIKAYSIDRASGDLHLINQLPIPGPSACYVAVDPTGRMLVTAHYTGGFVTAFSLRSDGSIEHQTALHKHAGTGPHQQQNAPHAHCIDFDPTNHWAFSADLSADKIFAYRISPDTASLEPCEPSAVATVRAGSGPRHLAFHPSGRFVYAINELAGTVSAFAFDPSRGSFTEIETISTLPAGFSGRIWCAEIAVHPSGNHLYASNRADHESIAVFSIDSTTGRLTPVQHVRDGIKHPRHFALFPDGRWLLCANHDANTVSVFQLDPASGRLTPSGTPTNVPAPVCIVFVR